MLLVKITNTVGMNNSNNLQLDYKISLLRNGFRSDSFFKHLIELTIPTQ